MQLIMKAIRSMVTGLQNALTGLKNELIRIEERQTAAEEAARRGVQKMDSHNLPQLGVENLVNDDDEHSQMGDEWAASQSNGKITYRHAAGSAESLIIPVKDVEPGALYAVAFTVDSEVTTDNLKVRLGGSELFELYGQAGGGNQTVVGLKAVDDRGLEFIPSTTFVGSISEISVRRIEAAAEPMQMVLNADGTTIEETRRIGDSLYMGLNSGRYTLQDKRGLNGATGSGNLALGRGALANVTSGFWNTAIGKDALGENDVGSRNIAIGRNALMGNKTGHRNIAIGTYALVHNSSGHHNIAIGADAMDGNTSGYGNVGIGFGTLYTNESGYGNTAIGASALNRSTSGYRNVAIGENALYSNTEQYNNVAVGFQAMSNLANKYSCNNVAIGNNAGMYLKTGGRNILIGADADIQDRTTGAGEWELNIGNLIRGKMSGRTAAPSTRYAIIDGGLQINDLPTSDPGIAGRLWSDNGLIKVSGQFDYEDPYTPVKGVDYWTEADQESIVQQVIDEFSEEIETVPQYVIDEAESVIDRIAAAQGGRTFVLAAITDLHYGNSSYTDGVKHACQALRYIDNHIKLDAVAVLGDITDGTTATNYSDAIADFRAVNAMLSDLRFAPNLRVHGNHDYYEGHMPEIWRYTSAYSEGVTWGDGAYFFRDFDRQKLRVICLDTVGDNVGNVAYDDAQVQWFANALDLSAKTDAASWGVLVLSHHPVDFDHATGMPYKMTEVINAYIKGTAYASDNVSCDFAGKNAATFIGNIHGHIHNLLIDRIYQGGAHAGTQIDALRIATPEACYGKANTYDGVWRQAETYGKQRGTGKDTSFVVYCIDLDTNTIKAVCYGAGYDRTITYGDDLYWDGMPDDGGGEGGDTVTYTNQVPIAIDMDGNTVVDGAMYPDSRWGSSGNVTAQEGYFITGLIPIKPGDFVRVRWNNTEKYGDAGYQGVRAFGADRTPIETRLPFMYMFDPSNEAGQKFTAVDGFRYDREGGVLDFQALAYSSIPANTVYLTFVLSGDPAETIITVNEPIGD